MQQSGMNYLYTKVSAVREQLILFANQIESLDFEYNAVVAELEQSFTDSKGFWERTTAEQKDTASHNAGVALERLNEMANGLNLLDVQLSQVDQSYAKRRDALSMVVVPNITYQTADAFLSRMEAIAQEAKKIASECSLTVKAQLLQEFTMLFSSKRKQLYERLAELIVEGKAIRDKAYTAIQQNLTETKTQLDAKNETEIDNAATETADLLAALEQRHNEELASTIISYETTIERLLPRADIENLRVLSDSLHNQELLPNAFSEFICFGSYGAPLGDVAYNTYVVSLINRLYSGFIENQNLCLPAILDLSDKANFLLFDEGESMRVRNAVNSLIYSLLSNQPASHQKFILFDPEGRSQGFAPYLEFMRSNPAVMYNKVFTTQQQLRTQIEELSSFIDEFSQTKLADSPDIFAYNRISVERPESLKCLCLLNFPKGFDEQMLEQLYNIVKNGSSCGVQTFIHFDEGAIRNSSSTTYVDLLAKIRENCICLQAGSDGWHSDDGTSWAFNTAPSQKTMADFSELYGSKYAEVTSSILPITKIIPEDIWFTGDSSALFSVPIGKDENGTVQYLEFGDPVSKGTSHHALVTGSLGSGKSTLLHTIIMSALTTYSPDELNLYLLDFKSGTEFQVYANHKIPHIKVLALDAMQEFGQSVLDELIGMMQKRLDMFTEETQKGYPVKDITSYRKYTGKKMPRILVVADEFQVLFSEAHNRRVANTCATRLADIISLYRVCGIHFILATQTMSRLRNGFTVSPCDCYKKFNVDIDLYARNLIEYIVTDLFKRCDICGLWFQEEFYHQPLTGLAHGQSGYALALSKALPYINEGMRLKVTSQIQKCMDYEYNCYDNSEMNLPDYRKLLLKKGGDKSQKKFMYGYCSGILGTALVVSELSEELISFQKKEIWKMNAVQYLKKDILIGNDSLCCGTAGWIDYLASCHKNEEWSDELFKKIIFSINEQGYVFNGLEGVNEISLFKGMSGIGYSVLRYMGKYPSVLL